MSLFKKITKKVGKSLDKLHLHSVKEQLNLKRLVKDPKGYFQSQVQGYKKDIAFAGSVWGRYTRGEWGSLAKEAASDTVKAAGGSGKQAAKAAAAGGELGDAYAAYKEGGAAAAAQSLAKGKSLGVVNLAAGQVDEAAALVSAYQAGTAGGDMNFGKFLGSLAGDKGKLGELARTAQSGLKMYENVKGSGGSLADVLKSKGPGLLSDALSKVTRNAAAKTQAPQITAAATIDAKMVSGKTGDGATLASATVTAQARRGGLLDAILALFGL